jgi:RimJ/RimL family protein N-acetyltransferase
VTTTAALCEKLEWDSRFFGRSIARALPSCLEPDTCRRILEWCHAERIECLYFLARLDSAPTTRLLEGADFHLVDVRITLDRVLTGYADASPVAARSAVTADIPALRAIARTSHRDTRFYFDGHFDTRRCDELYGTWIERSCGDWADHVVVVERDGAPVGYLTLHLRAPDAASIGLVGVDHSHRGQGVGRDLLRGGLAWLAERSVRRVSVVTQGRNLASQALYQGNGFRTSDVALWYHRWFVEHR